MKFLVAAGVFFLALVLKVPFWGAAALAGVAWALLHFAMKQNASLAGAHRPAQLATEKATDVPDGSNAGELRAYLRKLTYRVHTLEQELAALKGKPVPQEEKIQEPVREEPVVQQPEPEPEPQIPQQPQPQPRPDPDPEPQPQPQPQPQSQLQPVGP